MRQLAGAARQAAFGGKTPAQAVVSSAHAENIPAPFCIPITPPTFAVGHCVV